MRRPAASSRRRRPRCRKSSAAQRNWDYRFCWLRDATFTLLALMNSRLHRRGGRLAQLAVARGGGIARQHADHVRHHGPAAPAGMGGRLAARLRRRAAGAGRQRRACAVAARRLRRVDRRVSSVAHGAARSSTKARWALECAVLEHLAEVWDQPDHGIWERRGDGKHYVFSKVMTWVAFDRGIKSAETVRLRGAARQLADAAGRDPPRRLRQRL